MRTVVNFSDLYVDVTREGTKIPQEDYCIDGKYPIIDQGQNEIAGRWDDSDGLFSCVPAIVFGDHTRIIKYVDTPFFIGADGVKILRPVRKDDNPKYLYYALQAAKIPNLGYSRHFKVVKELRFNLYSRERQDKIAATLDAVTALMAKRHRQLDALDQLVKVRFVEMFGLPGTDTYGWGMTALGRTCEINPKKSQDERLTTGMQVSFIPMPAVSEKGNIDATQIKTYDEVKNGFTYFAEDDVLFAKITPCMENGKGAVAKGLYNGIGFGSTEFHVLRPIEGKTNPYWIYALTTFPQFRIDAASNMTGSAGQQRVPASFLENYRISVPPLELQHQFASFVTQVDRSKAAVQQSLQFLETLKKSLMQQYFG